MKNLINTGERQHTDAFDMNALEHLHRYALAGSLCHDLEVLDIASGEGYGSNILSRSAKSVFGVDISEDAIAHATKKYNQPNLRYLVGSADKIPLPDNSLDRVVSFETLEHHDKHEEMFLEIKRVLRPDGILIISTPDKLNYTDKPKQRNEFHVKELYLDEFRTLAKKYFANCAMYYQKTGYFGIIAPEVSGRYQFHYIEGDFQQSKVSRTIPGATYNICLASDNALPEPIISTYSGNVIYETLLSLSNDQTEKIARLQLIFENSRKEIDRLRASATFKIGSLITGPFKLARSFLNKK